MIYSNDFRGRGDKLDDEVSPRFWEPKQSIVAALRIYLSSYCPSMFRSKPIIEPTDRLQRITLTLSGCSIGVYRFLMSS